MKVKIQKFLKNQTSFGEKRKLLRWLSKNDENKEVFIQEVEKWSKNHKTDQNFETEKALKEFKIRIGIAEK
ncbi:hypothetical protein [Christiangramia salexigens]|uniref:Uncharacterized protein n=1 Tax=Christiangramia salexigens TaxID=1913577 RepID=A0A1L3J461_9FLAO|nr:hypothetical protein [Christiangramia salexigens]APG59917.1 hypothetical protein LPB144_05595 [Christiangramia salexigens]